MGFNSAFKGLKG